MWVWSLGWEDLLEQKMATQSSILAWKIPWREEPGKVQSMGLQRVGHDEWAVSWCDCFQGAGMPPQNPEGLAWAWRIPGPSQEDGWLVQHPLSAHCFFLKIYLMWPIFKSLYWICYYIVSALCFGFWPWGTKDGTCASCMEGKSVNLWITRKVPTRSSWEATLCKALSAVPVTWQMEFWGPK